MNNLDFDENDDDQITSADTTYWNSGAGWTPIGGADESTLAMTLLLLLKETTTPYQTCISA